MHHDRLFALLSEELPVVFTYIAANESYSGNSDDPVAGSHREIKKGNRHLMEMRSFERQEDGYFRGGVGAGDNLPPRFHVVFVAKFGVNGRVVPHRIVGVYGAAEVETHDRYPEVIAPEAALIPANNRPELEANWPGKNGMRRWASRPVGDRGIAHPSLLREFKKFCENLPSLLEAEIDLIGYDQIFSDVSANEGSIHYSLVIHRKRDAELRQAKLEAVRRSTGSLVCQVPRCGFEFGKVYGELGENYAQVHHLLPLSTVDEIVVETKLDDLAVVCANCHAMIHRGGGCRDIANLIPEDRPR